jgi:SAM-dependent methyltransferase
VAELATKTRKHPAAEWERFAEDNAYEYIKTDLADRSGEAFWQSGEAAVREEFVPLLDELRFARDCGLEIGCGVGRLVLPFSRLFGRMIGVDISEGMVRRAQEHARQRKIANVQFVAITEPSRLIAALPQDVGRVSFIYSVLVFQHIPDFQTIESYIAAIGQMLSHDGAAYLQFDTRPQTLPYHVKTAMPDFVLPKYWRRGIRRIRRSSLEIERAFARHGLKVVQERTPGSADHRYLLRVS